MSARRIYYWFSALLGFGMGATTTVYAPFLRSIGLSLGEIGLANAIYWCVVIASELPTGMLADGRSRAWSLKLGVAIQSIGGLAYFCANGFWSAVLAESLLGISAAFLSGAQQAWIADAMKREGCEESLARVYATEMLIRTGTFLVGGIVGAAWGLLSYRFVWLHIATFSLIALIFSRRHMNTQGEPFHRMGEMEAFKTSWTVLKTTRSLRWVIAAMMIFGLVVSFNHYWSVYFETMVGGLGLSWVWLLVFVGYMPAGWMVRRWSVSRRHEVSILLGGLFTAAIGLLTIVASTNLGISLAFVAVHEFGRGIFQPLCDSFVQHRVESSYRATFGSLQSFLGRMGFAVVPFVVWLAIEGEPNTPATIENVWLVCGMLLLVGTAVLTWLRPRSSENDSL